MSLRWRCAFVHVAPLALRDGPPAGGDIRGQADPGLIPQRGFSSKSFAPRERPGLSNAGPDGPALRIELMHRSFWQDSCSFPLQHAAVGQMTEMTRPGNEAP